MTKEQFKEKRVELGMTQAQLAKELGISIRLAQYYEGCGGEREVPKLIENYLTTLKPKRARPKRAREVETCTT